MDNPDRLTDESFSDNDEALGLPTAPMPWAAREALRSCTPARVALDRAGVSVATGPLLEFQLAHAQARDAVAASIDPRMMCDGLRRLGFEALALKSAAANRSIYLKRPDLGRVLDPHSSELLIPGDYAAVFVIADGLSALAIERHAVPLLQELRPLLSDWPFAPVCVVEQGRVAMGDAIGQALRARLSVVLIGERPGLSSPDSLGAYITWNPRPGRTDAERNCISNIRDEGLSYSAAARRLLYYMTEASRLGLTGIRLKDPEEQTEQLD